jgi:hypothetical protein
MPWLPSHQELREHPKTRRLTVMLGVPRAQVIGHLHCLWWWALTYADDGDLTRFDSLDIALAAEWEGDPQTFVDALLGCGGGGGAGFLDVRGDDGLWLHDWDEYGGKYVEKRRREADRLREHRKSSEGRTNGVRSTDAVDTANVGGKRRVEKSREEVIGASGEPKLEKRPLVLLPEGWAPNEKHKSFASENGLDLDHEADQFRSHHQAKGSTYKDWDAAFRTWLGNAKKFQAQAPRHLRAVVRDEEDWLNTVGNLSVPLEELLRDHPA